MGVAQLDGESRGYVCIINQGRHPTVPEGMATVEAICWGTRTGTSTAWD